MSEQQSLSTSSAADMRAPEHRQMWCRSVAAAHEVEDNARAPSLHEVRCACSAELNAMCQLCNQSHGLHTNILLNCHSQP